MGVNLPSVHLRVESRGTDPLPVGSGMQLVNEEQHHLISIQIILGYCVGVSVAP